LDIYFADLNPTTGAETDRWLTPILTTGEAGVVGSNGLVIEWRHHHAVTKDNLKLYQSSGSLHRQPGLAGAATQHLPLNPYDRDTFYYGGTTGY
jgi:hypothetical protein